MYKHLKGAALAAVALATMAEPAHAQLAVIDVKAVAQALETAQNTLKQLEEAQKLYSSVNSISNIGDVAKVLNSKLLQSSLPEGVSSSTQLLSSDLTALGKLGDSANSILSNKNLTLSGASKSVSAAQSALKSASTVSAKSQALAQNALQTTEESGDGLKDLSSSLSSSTTLRDSTDIAARAAIENAAINNRMLQLYATEQGTRNQLALDAADSYAKEQRETSSAVDDGSIYPKWNSK